MYYIIYFYVVKFSLLITLNQNYLRKLFKDFISYEHDLFFYFILILIVLFVCEEQLLTSVEERHTNCA